MGDKRFTSHACRERAGPRRKGRIERRARSQAIVDDQTDNRNADGLGKLNVSGRKIRSTEAAAIIAATPSRNRPLV